MGSVIIRVHLAGKSSRRQTPFGFPRSIFADAIAWIRGRTSAQGSPRPSQQSSNQVVCKSIGNLRRGESAFGIEPTRAPVEGTQQRARGKRGITRNKFSRTNAGDNQLAHCIFIAVTFRG